MKKIIRLASNASIPQQHFIKRSSVPWWNSSLNKLRAEKQAAWRNFCNQQSINNLIEYRKLKAKFRYESRKSKTNSFLNFTQSINRDSNISDLWGKINRLSNKSNHKSILSIKSDNHLVTNNTEIANEFGKVWSKYSKDDNFCQKFKNEKHCCQNLNSTFALNNAALEIEKSISITELNMCLTKCKGKTPGSDRISYKMLKALDPIGKFRL